MFFWKKTKNIHPPQSPPPPSYGNAQAAAPSIYLHPDLESKKVVKPQATITSKQEPAATPLGRGNIQRKDEEDGIFPPDWSPEPPGRQAGVRPSTLEAQWR